MPGLCTGIGAGVPYPNPTLAPAGMGGRPGPLPEQRPAAAAGDGGCGYAEPDNGRRDRRAGAQRHLHRRPRARAWFLPDRHQPLARAPECHVQLLVRGPAAPARHRAGVVRLCTAALVVASGRTQACLSGACLHASSAQSLASINGGRAPARRWPSRSPAHACPAAPDARARARAACRTRRGRARRSR